MYVLSDNYLSLFISYLKNFIMLDIKLDELVSTKAARNLSNKFQNNW